MYDQDIREIFPCQRSCRHGAPLRRVAYGNDHERLFVRRPIEDGAQKGHTARCIGKGRQPRMLCRGEQDSNGNAEGGDRVVNG